MAAKKKKSAMPAVRSSSRLAGKAASKDSALSKSMPLPKSATSKKLKSARKSSAKPVAKKASRVVLLEEEYKHMPFSQDVFLQASLYANEEDTSEAEEDDE